MNIEYRSGSQNYEADLLSRIGEDRRIYLIAKDKEESETTFLILINGITLKWNLLNGKLI